MTSHILRTSSVENEGQFQASKWIHLQFLIDIDEINCLLHSLGNIEIFSLAGVHETGHAVLSKEKFLSTYESYISQLKNGIVPDPLSYRNIFTVAMTGDRDCLYSLPTQTGKELVRIFRPVIQVQPLNIHYSPVDHQFRANIFGEGSITWGLQFSYPQQYADPITKNPIKVFPSRSHINSILFLNLQKWMRNNTQPTPFNIDGKKVYIPYRIGKKCLSWVDQHPQLENKGLFIETGKNSS